MAYHCALLLRRMADVGLVPPGCSGLGFLAWVVSPAPGRRTGRQRVRIRRGGRRSKSRRPGLTWTPGCLVAKEPCVGHPEAPHLHAAVENLVGQPHIRWRHGKQFASNGPDASPYIYGIGLGIYAIRALASPRTTGRSSATHTSTQAFATTGSPGSHSFVRQCQYAACAKACCWSAPACPALLPQQS